MVKKLSRQKVALFVAAFGCACAQTSLAKQGFSSIFEALSNPARPALDTQLDPLRKPEQVLDFFGVKANMQVLDVLAGSGYYTELLSHIVGKSGHVVMHNHPSWLPFYQPHANERLKNGRLTNVTALVQDINDTEFEKERFDVALIILGLHDLYLDQELAGTSKPFDINGFLAKVYQSVKPGGVLGVVEHNAKSGMPPVQSATLHRLDAQHIVKLMEQTGFKLEQSSEMLANPNDDYTESVFAKHLRRKTDRSVLRFRKPFI